MAAKNGRTAVTARGAALLGLINDAGENGLMLTQAEGLDAINAGFAVVDTSVVEGDTAKLTLTDAGRAALSPSPAATSSYEIEDNVEIPAASKTRRARSGGYPFEALGVGQSFHVAGKDGEAAEKVAARMQSSVSGARAKFAEDTGETETVLVKVYARDEAGAFIKDENGKRVVASQTETSRPKTKATREFTVKAVGSDDPKGPGARIWRTV